jgi:hypothetical protein
MKKLSVLGAWTTLTEFATFQISICIDIRSGASEFDVRL